jgi:hypothetical protein
MNVNHTNNSSNLTEVDFAVSNAVTLTLEIASVIVPSAVTLYANNIANTSGSQFVISVGGTNSQF